MVDLTNCIVFRRRGIDLHNTFMLTDPRTDIEYGPFKTTGSSMDMIKTICSLDQLITWKWDSSNSVSFYPYTVEHWLRKTYAERGVKKTDLDAEIATLRQGGSW